ncbi:hypothetical protein VNO78_07343 [Psophocarpus tetragonolobus]|uniref:Uncharacterized protein n=1 Tax=Psophocarpus tetragonolobus TaxID=3891 RepID=A0AAN9SW15_PSOTE
MKELTQAKLIRNQFGAKVTMAHVRLAPLALFLLATSSASPARTCEPPGGPNLAVPHFPRAARSEPVKGGDRVSNGRPDRDGHRLSAAQIAAKIALRRCSTRPRALQAALHRCVFSRADPVGDLGFGTAPRAPAVLCRLSKRPDPVGSWCFGASSAARSSGSPSPSNGSTPRVSIIPDPG